MERAAIDASASHAFADVNLRIGAITFQNARIEIHRLELTAKQEPIDLIVLGPGIYFHCPHLIQKGADFFLASGDGTR